ncbi:unnamed protein product [Mytilus edulis]|uniref:Endonuclease/exonuclease/phosphatase domain-containing protein n=1 Tax=Mytilus edulis TaxID=6550 RepID=A0A8S3U249_MYTED|nr:unnamed protein product [Mytilus edulis]
MLSPQEVLTKVSDAYRAALGILKELLLKYQRTHSIIIAGDFNASFNRQYKDTQDELFKNFCKENQIELPSNYPIDHTYHQKGQGSIFDLLKLKQSSASQFTHTIRTEEKEASTPNEINNVFKDHFEKLAKTNSNPNFNIGHDNLVKLDMETIVNICENQEITIQPVTSTEITKRISILKRKKGWGCRRFNCRTSNLWWNRVD